VLAVLAGLDVIQLGLGSGLGLGLGLAGLDVIHLLGEIHPCDGNTLRKTDTFTTCQIQRYYVIRGKWFTWPVRTKGLEPHLDRDCHGGGLIEFSLLAF